MKLFDRRMSTGWSFVLGMLFGALLVFARIETSSGAGANAHGSAPPAMELSVHPPSSPVLDPKDAKDDPPPTASVGARSHAARTPSREIRHTECELQLD